MPPRFPSIVATTGAARVGIALAGLVCSLSGLLRGAETVRLERVEVTAPGAERARSDGPGAVTAYGGDFLAANGIADYENLARVVPGLFVTAQSVENVSLNLRGLTSDTNDPRVQPRVSVFQDGLVLANSHGNSVALFDMARIAVFKGPQPTQFGRGVQGGALALTSNRATNVSNGALTVELGDFEARSAELTVNRPLVADQLFARVAVYANHRDGYVHNLADGPDLQGEDTFALRTSLRWQPTAATTVDMLFNYQHDDAPGIGAKTMLGVPGLPPVADTNPFTSAQLNRGAELGATRTIKSLTGIVNQKLNDAWTLTATGGWREVDSNNEFDADGSLYYLIEGGERFHAQQLSQEVRFDYDRGGRLTAMAGLAAFHEKDDQTVTIRSDENALWQFFTRTPPPVAFNPRYAEQTLNQAEMTAGDAFGRADYKLTDRFTVGAGGRLTQERLVSRIQTFAAVPRGNLAGLLPSSGNGNDFVRNTNGPREHAAEVRSWSGQVDARYAVTRQVTAFVLVSRGRRPPVLDFNEITLAAQTHAEETVWNTEAGIKGASAGRRFRYDASVFQYQFDHFQTQRIVTPGVTQTFDGGRARGRGLETTLQADLAREVSAFATYGFTDAKFSARDGEGAPQLYAGNMFRLTSRHVVSVGGTVTRAAGGGAVFLTPLVSYRSGYFFEDNNAQNGGILRQGGYALMNLRVGYRARGGRWEVVATANNLLGKNYLLDAGNVGAAFGIPTSIRAAPRMLGVKATVRF